MGPTPTPTHDVETQTPPQLTTTTKGREPDVTTPNDILDAYDEIARLVNTLGIDTIQQLVDRVAGWIATPTQPLADPEPTDDPPTLVLHTTGCPWCGLDISKNTMLRHLNTAHGDDLEQLYIDDGIKGLQDTFGVPYATAWNWARKIDGEAA